MKWMTARLTRVRTLVALVITAAMMLAAIPASSGAVTLDGSPQFPPVADASTDTVYVPIQCQDETTPRSCNQTASHVLDMLDSTTCTASSAQGCQVVATAAAGDEPVTAAIDRRTDTIFVGDARGGGAGRSGGGGGAVTIVDGATCNVSVRTGCATPIATIRLGHAFPAGLAFDPATGTLYVADANGAVDVLDVSHCSASSTSSCNAPVKTIADAAGPVAVAVDVATDTVYAANGNFEEQSDTVSVINGATCNAVQGTGCGQTPSTVPVGTSPQWDVVDQATNTIYVANELSGSVSLINGDTCNGTDTSSCGQPQPAVLTGTGDSYMELDSARHTLFSLNQDNDTMSEIDIRTCNALTPTSCPIEARNEQVPFDPPTGEAGNVFTISGGGDTAYVVSAGGASLLQPISIGACDAQDTAGCRVEAPQVAEGIFFPEVDASTHTLYAGNTLQSGVDVFNTQTCHAGDLASCTPVAVIPTVGPQANLGSIDDATHTLYVGNPVTDLAFNPARTISVINIAHCDATDTSGCDAPAAAINVGAFPGPPQLDTATNTLYDPYSGDGNRLAVINVRHCNAEDDTGCGRQHPVSMPIPSGAAVSALSEQTDTLYLPGFLANEVAVVNGATCNGSVHTGCGHPATVISTGSSPSGAVVDDADNTLYVSNGGAGDSPGSVSVINTQECNGSHPSGCGQTWPTAAIGRQPQDLALDPATGDVYAADEGSAGVSVIDGESCNAGTTTGCTQPTAFVPITGGPATLAVDPWSDTVYAGGDIGHPVCCGGVGSMSVFSGNP